MHIPTWIPTRHGIALPLVLSLTLPGCWTVQDDDAGSEAFAAWATTTVLGRRPLSHNEIEALVEVEEQLGREAVIDVLFDEPEFVARWTEVFRDDLRFGLINGQASGTEVPIDDTCFGKELMSPFDDADLVEHIATEGWDQEFCGGPVLKDPAPSQGDRTVGVLHVDPPVDAEAALRELERAAGGSPRIATSPMHPLEFGIEYYSPSLDLDNGYKVQGVSRSNPVFSSCNSFTMADVFRATLTEDRLDVLYLAALGPLAAINTGQGITTAKFMEGWLDRDPGCVACHTTHYSTTDPAPRNEAWDRTHLATWIDVEGTVFSYTDGNGDLHYGGDGGNAVGDRITAFFRDDVFQAEGGRQPWGIDASCVSQSSHEGFATSLPSGTTAAFAGLYGEYLSPLHLMEAFQDGVDALDLNAPAVDLAAMPVLDGNPGNSADGAIAVAGCEASCHNAANSADPLSIGYLAPYPLTTHTKNMTPARLFDIITQGSPAGLMSAGWTTEDGARDIVAYLTSVDQGHVNNVYHTNRAAGFAHLTAMAIADNVYEEITGASLILDHGLPRNPDAAANLEELTRVFVAEGWSLRALIKQVMLSELANRNTPADSALARYALPMVFEPWADVNELVVAPNSAAGDDANGQGDVVHRWSVPSLLSQAQHALLWPAPELFPADESLGNNNVYGDVSLRRDLGDYVNFNDQGFGELPLTAMVAWEREIDGCANPGDTDDYITILTDPVHGLTLSQAMLAVKDRLISDGRWYDGDAIGADGPVEAGAPVTHESKEVEAAFGVSIDDPAADHEDAVRQYCTSLLLSPQFLFSGLPAWDAGHPPPDPDPAVPCVDDRCSQTDHCEHYRDTAYDLGYNYMSCGAWGPLDEKAG